MSYLIEKILKEGLPQQLLDKESIKIIAQYVNENKSSNKILSLTIPNKLKYKGVAYRLINCTAQQVKDALAGKPFKEKRSFLSFSKSLRGLTELHDNMKADNPNYFQNALIIKEVISLDDCIIDITKFGEVFPSAVHSGYTDYIDEEEVICKNNFTVNKKNIDGYAKNGEFKRVK